MTNRYDSMSDNEVWEAVVGDQPVYEFLANANAVRQNHAAAVDEYIDQSPLCEGLNEDEVRSVYGAMLRHIEAA